MTVAQEAGQADGGPLAEQSVIVLTGLSGRGEDRRDEAVRGPRVHDRRQPPRRAAASLGELVADDPARFEHVAIVLDVRAGDVESAFADIRASLSARGIRPRVLFLEARDEVLIRRFSETRHRHPLSGQKGIAGSIAEERRLLSAVREEADVIIDTSDLSLRELRERLFASIPTDVDPDRLVVQVVSFGFKFGVPLEADIVLDVRFLKNPYYVAELKQISGLTDPVRAYVLEQPIAPLFLDHVGELLDLIVPAYVDEGKSRLTVAVGCTGGYHRSIVIAEEIATRLRARDDLPVAVFHRELEQA